MTPLQYFKRFLLSLPALSKRSGYSVAHLFMSYVVCYIFHGANSEEFCAQHLYEFDNTRRGQFLFIRETEKLSDRLNAGATEQELAAFDDKHLFNTVFCPFIRRDWLYMPEASIEDIQAFLSRHDSFLVKACVSTQGKGITKYSSADTSAEALLARYGGKSFLLEGFLRQHPDMAALNPSTVNTLRIQTVRKGDKVLLVGGCVRCGGADAFHQGGVAYPLDMETGVVVCHGRKLTGEFFRRHPSTGRFMPGFQVPFWEQVTETVKKAAVTVPHVGYVGWDVAVTPDGPELIEGNINYPDPIVVQLDDRGVRRLVRDFVEGA